MTINELLDKPVWQMTGEELLFLAQHGNTSQKQGKKTTPPKKKGYMCMDWQVSHAYLDAVYLLPTVSSRVVKSTVPLHKWGGDYCGCRPCSRVGWS